MPTVTPIKACRINKLMRTVRTTIKECRVNGKSTVEEIPKALNVDLEKAPMVNFMAKVLSGIKKTGNSARVAKQEAKKNGGKFCNRLRAWVKGFTQEGKSVIKKDIAPQIGEVTGITSIKQIAGDKGVIAAGTETLKMGIIDMATVASYAAVFAVPFPGVATTLSILVNTGLRNVKWLKPYSQKLAEAAKKGSEEVIKVVEEAARKSGVNPEKIIKSIQTQIRRPVKF